MGEWDLAWKCGDSVDGEKEGPSQFHIQFFQEKIPWVCFLSCSGMENKKNRVLIGPLLQHAMFS